MKGEDDFRIVDLFENSLMNLYWVEGDDSFAFVVAEFYDDENEVMFAIVGNHKSPDDVTFEIPGGYDSIDNISRFLLSDAMELVSDTQTKVNKFYGYEDGELLIQAAFDSLFAKSKVMEWVADGTVQKVGG